MDLLADFEAFFKAQGIAGTYYKDTMLATPDAAISIYEYAGSGATAQIAGASRSIQVVARAKVVSEVKTLINALYHSLITEDGIIYLTAERWCGIGLRQSPFKLKVDTEGRSYYCFNVAVTTYID